MTRNIRSVKAFEEAWWNFTFLTKLLPPKIKGMDVDHLIERRGRKLIIETKKPGAEIPLGQRIALESFVKDDSHPVMILWGVQPEDKNQTPIIERFDVWLRTAQGGIRVLHFNPGTIEQVQRAVKRWWDSANKETK